MCVHNTPTPVPIFEVQNMYNMLHMTRFGLILRFLVCVTIVLIVCCTEMYLDCMWTVWVGRGWFVGGGRKFLVLEIKIKQSWDFIYFLGSFWGQ